MPPPLCVTITWSRVWVGFWAGGSEALDYRTISGVNGPLVVLENVKVGERCARVIFLGTPFL